MSAKMKMFIVYAATFFGVFIVMWFLAGLFLEDDHFIRKLGPILVAVVFAPKPHIEDTQSGKQYGLKSVFSKKIVRFKD